MRDYIIMTDSCCDLNQQEVDELGLTVLPLSFTIDGKTYLNTPDHAEMSPEEFFAKIAAGENSTTAAANVGQFDEAMRRALDAGKDILCICFSGALSTTYQSACIAAEGVDEDYFRRIRKASFGANLRGLNSFENIAVTLTEGYFHGYDPLRFPEVFDSITPEDITAFLKTNVTAERMAVSRIVPKQ